MITITCSTEEEKKRIFRCLIDSIACPLVISDALFKECQKYGNCSKCIENKIRFIVEEQ